MWSIRLDVNWHFIVSVPQDHCIRLWHYIDKPLWVLSLKLVTPDYKAK